MTSETPEIPAQDTAPAPKLEPKPTPKQSKLAAFWAEIKGLFWLLLAVLGFHSFIAKPFYIPSISMMPTLLVGDRLFVSKYAYGWSHVSPTIPNPVAIFKSYVLGQEVDSLAFVMPASNGRIWGKMPTRGDIVILTPKGKYQDWIKRVIGVPGDVVEVRSGQVFISGKPVRQETQPTLDLAVDANNPCSDSDFPGALNTLSNGKMVCSLPIIRETLPNGVSYDTIDAKRTPQDNFGPVKIPAGHVFIMGDNRDNSSDSRVPDYLGGLDGPVTWDRIGGRAEIITFSVDGSTSLNPLTWFSSLRGGRAGTSLRPDKSPGSKPSAPKAKPAQ